MNEEKQTIAAIQKAVPEIMELKKGCRIKTVFGEFVDIVKDEKMPDGEIMTNSSDYNYQYINIAEILEIIGRPITLEDVFKALRGRNKDKRVLIAINEEGEFMEWLSGWEEIDVFYDFDKPFTEQSKETKELLYNLIVKE